MFDLVFPPEMLFGCRLENWALAVNKIDEDDVMLTAEVLTTKVQIDIESGQVILLSY